MPPIRFNLDVLNAIATGLGSGGGHRRNLAALNDICARLGGSGGHRRTLAALNEWAARAGGVGGHRRTLGALNQIDLALGGAGGHRRSFVALADALQEATGRTFTPFASRNEGELALALKDASVIVAAGAAGKVLLPESVRRGLARLKVAIDLNAVPPLGIEGISATDRDTNHDGVRAWGALGVGASKMKIHKRAIQELFKGNDKVLDAEEALAIGRSLG
jgi:hypothetical protein